MNIAENIHNSFNLIKQNKVRSVLTMLGIVIGIMGVIVIISVGNSAQNLILDQIRGIGSNLIAVMPGSSDNDGPPASVMGIVITTLKYDDIKAIKSSGRAPYVKEVAAYVQGQDTVTWQGNKTDSAFVGTSASLPLVEDFDLSMGNFFTEEDEKALQKVAVLGSDVYKELFQDQDPLGELVKIGKHNFRIMGVVEERGSSGFSNQDNQIYVPLPTAQKLLLGINYVSVARIKIGDENKIDVSRDDIKYILRDRHNIGVGEPEDFSVRTQQDGLEALMEITNAIKFFLAAIAGIALIVGGIGIMNIMLVAVQERIREIGLRKAVGAKK